MTTAFRCQKKGGGAIRKTPFIYWRKGGAGRRGTSRKDEKNIMEDREISLRVIHTDLPDTINGATAQDPRDPDSYTVILNARKGQKQQLLSFLHEMIHVYQKDFESGQDVETVERLAHGIIEEIMAHKGA